jgi:hypothetical protein
MKYAPSVILDGQDLPTAAWDGRLPTVLDELTFQWGRDDIYARNEPVIATVHVLTSEPGWAANQEIVGRPLHVRRWTYSPPYDYEVTMFRGTVSDTAVVPVKVWNETTRRNEVAWRVEITAADPMADLAQTQLNSVMPGVNQWNFDTNETEWLLMPGYWPNRSPWVRTRDLEEAGLRNYLPGGMAEYNLSTRVAPYTYGDPNAAFLVAIPDPSEYSLLDVIHTVTDAYPLGWFQIDPSAQQGLLGEPTQDAGMKLTLENGKLVVTPAAGASVPANTVQVPDEFRLSGTAAQAIDVVRTKWKRHAYLTERAQEGWEEERTAHYDPAVGGMRALEIETEWWATWPNEGTNNPWNPVGYHLPEAQAQARKIRDLVDDMNGRFTPPPITFDLRRFDYSETVLGLLLRLRTFTTPLYFPGAVWEQFPNVGPQFQVIGGTVAWKAADPGADLEPGWVITANLATAAGATDPVTITTLVSAGVDPNGGPTLEDFHPDLSIEALGNVTIGYIP